LYFVLGGATLTRDEGDMQFLSPEWHERVTSTNTVLLERLKGGEELISGFVLAAREQTAGRGRYERKWVSEEGGNLAFSFWMRTRVGVPQVLSLPQAVALGVVEAVGEFGIEAQVKWPNDLLVEGRKICGILAEGEGEGLVVGVGINVNMGREEAAGIDRPATSMMIESGREFAVEGLLERVLDRLPAWIEKWEEGGFAALREAWMARCVGLGEEVAVGEARERSGGVLEGFGEAGQLLLRQVDGTVKEVWSGDLGLGR
jgi:BirA family transcriptional regulator, biotin operon repressor / biotin---[acetyl-CoA-carboxylase] ligase